LCNRLISTSIWKRIVKSGSVLAEMDLFNKLLAYVALALLACTTAYACGDTAPPKKGWVLPSGSKYIVSSSPIEFQGPGIPSPIEAEGIHYREHKYIFRAPSGAAGWWEIREAVVLKQNGRPFAFLARIYYPILDKHGRVVSSFGCVREAAIYDEDGDGRFETVTDSLNSSLQLSVHLPVWAAQKRGQ
jgi:hypothetical protein